MGFLKSIMGRGDAGGAAGAPGGREDLPPLKSSHAAAEAAVAAAILRRKGCVEGVERRDAGVPDRRGSGPAAATYGGPERRGPIADRRTMSKDFGRRTRG